MQPNSTLQFSQWDSRSVVNGVVSQERVLSMRELPAEAVSDSLQVPTAHWATLDWVRQGQVWGREGKGSGKVQERRGQGVDLSSKRRMSYPSPDFPTCPAPFLLSDLHQQIAGLDSKRPTDDQAAYWR